MAATASKGRVLVVDDERRNVMVIATRLRALGYEVLEAKDGGEALAILRSTPVDLVLSDVMMPVVDGFELIRRIRSDTTLAALPVVLVTALDGTADRVRGFEAGASDFLTKPVNPAELELRVQSQVRLHRLQQELDHRSQILRFSAEADDPPAGRVFVLEDDPHWRAVLIELLQARGYVVEAACDLGSGIAAAERADPDVLLVDLKLPDGEGSDFIRLFRNLGLERHVPAIMVVTGVDDAQEKLACLRHGADDYVTKPITPVELLARVESQMRRSRASRLAVRQAERARGDAHTDPLTGLYNRRFLDEDLRRRVRGAASRADGFAVALLDIDHFKRVNDSYGHPVGDAVLRTVAGQVRKSLRESDLACRYGGEEFVAIFPSTGLREARIVADRLRTEIQASECPPLPAEAVTVSIGLAEWTPGEDAGDLLRRADEALYAAKHAGRNRVEEAAAAIEGGTSDR